MTLPKEFTQHAVQARTMLKIERAKEKEKLTRKEKSMADAKAALAATYAKYGIVPLSEKPKPELRPSVMVEFKRKQLTPDQAAKMHAWLAKDRLSENRNG